MAHNRGNGNADRAEPSAADLRRWRQHLANERAEAGVDRDLAQRRTGAERDILLALAAAEGRHEQHWLALLKGTSASRAAATSARGYWVFWPATSDRSSCWR